MNFRGFSSLRKYGIFEDFHLFDRSVGAHGAQGPRGPGALGPRYSYQGLGAQGPWGPVITTRAPGPPGYAQQTMSAHASGVLLR